MSSGCPPGAAASAILFVILLFVSSVYAPAFRAPGSLAKVSSPSPPVAGTGMYFRQSAVLTCLRTLVHEYLLCNVLREVALSCSALITLLTGQYVPQQYPHR